MAREKPKIITADDIMQFTNGGRDVFEREMGRLTNKLVKSPLRDDGKIPSFEIKRSSSSGLWIFKDHGGTQENGNCITFVSSRYGITYTQAIEKIANDFGLSNKEIKVEKKIFIPKEKPPEIWEYSIQPFQDEHKRYMDRYYLDEEFLNEEGDVFALKSFAINKKVQKAPGEEYSFVYVHRDINGKETGKIKVLRLGKNLDPKHKWRTNLENSALWYTYKIPKNCKDLFIVKSVKDANCLSKHYGIHCVATQNESSILLFENNYEYLDNAAKNKVMCFGSDFQGWHESLIITTLTGWQYFNTPNHLYDRYEIEDVSDYIERYKPDSLKVLLKNKNYL